MRKIKRYGDIFSNRPKKILKAIAWIIGCLAVVFIGFSVTKPIMNYLSGETDFTSQSSTSSKDNQDTQTTTSHPSSAPVAKNNVKAAFLPLSVINNEAKLTAYIQKAKQMGLNSCLVELKNSDGYVNYKSNLPLVQQAKAQNTNAFDAAALAERLKKEGLQPISYISCFYDKIAPIELRAAAVQLKGSDNWLWYDDYPDKGGRPWLNLYSKDAQSYITSIINETVELGYKTCVLDYFEFPDSYGLELADYGDQSNQKTKLAAVSEYIKNITDNFKQSDVSIILAADTKALLGNNAVKYGGNPLDTPINIISPKLLFSQLGSNLKIGEETIANPGSDRPEAVRKIVEFIKTRTDLSDDNKQFLPILQYPSDDIESQISVLNSLGIQSYILYSAEGNL